MRWSKLFPRLVAAVSASLVPACAPSSAVTPEDALDAPSCSAANALPAALPDGVDYVELRVDTTSFSPGESSVTTTVLASRGKRCGGTSDVSACEAKLAAPAVPATTCSGSPCRQLSVVWQAGANVGRLTTPADVVARYGPITNESRALLAGHLYVSARGDALKCSADSPKQLTPSTFQLLTVGAKTGGICTQVETTITTASVLELDQSGNVRVVDSASTEDTREGSGACPGRKPAGLREVASGACRSLGEYFANAAHLEHASVTAFHVLATELAALGAPRKLRDRAMASARDEVRHTHTMTALARRFGAHAPPAIVAPAQARTALAIALENVREGCVGETYAALVAAWQAKHAECPAIRAAFTFVARDEARHAALAWNVRAFLGTLLEPRERALVEAERLRALADLRVALREEPVEELVRTAGLPDATRAALLLDALVPELAAAA